MTQDAKALAEGVVVKLVFGKFTSKDKKESVWVETAMSTSLTRKQWKDIGEPREMEVLLVKGQP